MESILDVSASARLLFPELLSEDELVEHLRQKLPKNKYKALSCTMDKKALLDVFNRTVLPMPQRIYKRNRRGHKMTHGQTSLARKRTHEDKGTPCQKRQHEVEHPKKFSGLVTSFGHSGNRLKPPPDVVNIERKVITLNKRKTVDLSSIKSTTDLNTCKRGAKYTGTSDIDISPSGTEETVIAKSSQMRLCGNQKSTMKNTEENMDISSGEGKVTKKIQKITWP